MNKFIAIDTETGGIGEEADLLTAFFGILDEDLNLVTELTIRLRPDSEDDFFHVSAKALEINGILLIDHFKVALPKNVAGQELFRFLNENTPMVDGKKQRLIPIGHNVAFDIKKIADKLLNKKTLDQFIGYRTLDTGTIGQFLQVARLIPSNVSASLSSLMAHYNIPFEGQAHNERVDAMACVALIKRMLQEFK